MINLKPSGPLAVFTGIGFEIVALILAAVWIGSHIDRHFELKGVGTIVMIVAVTILWMFHVFVMLKKLNQNQSQPPPDQK